MYIVGRAVLPLVLSKQRRAKTTQCSMLMVHEVWLKELDVWMMWYWMMDVAVLWWMATCLHGLDMGSRDRLPSQPYTSVWIDNKTLTG